MSPLEEELQEQKGLVNKGYSIQEIQCAALQLQSQFLRIIADAALKITTPTMHAISEGDDGAD